MYGVWVAQSFPLLSAPALARVSVVRVVSFLGMPRLLSQEHDSTQQLSRRAQRGSFLRATSLDLLLRQNCK